MTKSREISSICNNMVVKKSAVLKCRVGGRAWALGLVRESRWVGQSKVIKENQCLLKCRVGGRV